ncbi:MAG: PASTA domain-containing protein [Nocardioidaceae bacterium]
MVENNADVAIRAERFAELVGEQLADMPARHRARVLDDLATHLQETNEDGVSLLDQQGSPEEYAAELRNALSHEAPELGARRSRWWAIAVAAGVAAALIVAAVVVLPRLYPGGGSTTPPNQTETAAPSPTVAVPSLIGLTQAEATLAIEDAKLLLGSVKEVTSSSVPKGVVAAVSPVPGSDVPTGSAVDITVSTGPA